MADKKPRTFGAPMGTPDSNTDYSRGRPQVGMNREQIRKAMREPSRASTPYQSSSQSERSVSRPGVQPRMLGRGKAADAARAVNPGGRQRQVDRAVDEAVTGKKPKR